MQTSLNSTQRAALRNQCHTFFSGHRQLSPATEFAALAAWCEAQGATADSYGEGGLLTALEEKFCALLGKPAAVFMPSGKMAQLIALKIHTEQARLARFGMHASSHLELHEARAYAALLGLHGVLVGDPATPIQAADLALVTDPLGCLVIELPMRERGGLLPRWDQLQALSHVARSRGLMLHMDGARLWECGSHFAPQSYADVAALFDSVYVSCYKGLGGMSGAVLAGSSAFVASARTWQVRFGGQLPQQTAAAASVAMRIDAQITAMPHYLSRAREAALALATLPGVRVTPDVPMVNMMHVHVQASPSALARARDAHAEHTGIWAFNMPRPHGTGAAIELYVGEHLLAVTDEVLIENFSAVLAEAAAIRDGDAVAA